MWGDRKEALKQLKDSIEMYAVKQSSADPEDHNEQGTIGSVYDLTPEMMGTPVGNPAVVTAYIEVGLGFGVWGFGVWGFGGGLRCQ